MQALHRNHAAGTLALGPHDGDGNLLDPAIADVPGLAVIDRSSTSVFTRPSNTDPASAKSSPRSRSVASRLAGLRLISTYRLCNYDMRAVDAGLLVVLLPCSQRPRRGKAASSVGLASPPAGRACRCLRTVLDLAVAKS
ncbi:hypothetical protein OKW76_09245 [Sphingomonas sp. S1-29]|uniref:hypothetical protein n=1 Tax=Sphingomonas sp. S1-29 TaxID=2991074 RepID=UPI00224000D0|nr:hypothetical protein [Sphingomonas sp. S1-29]UZK68257.1 hypothetical protein OKW76_09245 [Sphingomonas sp. S1-29]